MNEIKINKDWFIGLQKLVNKFEDSKDSNDLDYLLGYLQSIEGIIKNEWSQCNDCFDSDHCTKCKCCLKVNK